MATGKNRITDDERAEASGKEDITFTPMAMPMLSGPGAIGVVIGLGASATTPLHTVGVALGIVALGISVLVILRSSEPLSARLGASAVGALNRVFGFFILAIAVQLLWGGFQDLMMKPA
jgi:multiple antibiotic resistance protein